MELTSTLRPRQFNDVIGQVDIKELITSALKTNRFPKLSMFSGESGIGKSTLAELSALALTCESPIDAEPCCQCKTCQDNIRALASGKNTDSIVKVNMGLISSKKDILEVIKEIFILQPRTNGNVVYILEEIHAIPQESQIPLLEELMSIPDGIYIILCTTQPYKVIQELRGRATGFSLGLPSVEECMELIDLACAKAGIPPAPQEAKKWLCRNSGNSPREIVKVVDILSVNGSLDINKIKNYLGAVTSDKYIDFFEVLYTSGQDLASLMFWLEEIKTQGVPLTNFVKGLKDFVIDLAITLYGSINEGFSRDDRERLKAVFANITQSQFLDMIQYIDTMKYYTEKESIYSILLLKRHVMGITKKTIISQSANKAMAQTIASERKSNNKQKEKRQAQLKATDRNSEITEEGIQAILKSNKAFRPATAPEAKAHERSELRAEHSEAPTPERSEHIPLTLDTETTNIFGE